MAIIRAKGGTIQCFLAKTDDTDDAIKGGITSKTIFKYIMRQCQLKRMAWSFDS